YSSASALRSVRQQQADVFRRVNGALKAALSGDSLLRARAIADNRLLWITLIDLLQDPENPLPLETRAALISVGLAVHRNLDRDPPDFAFLVAVNENIAAGLAGEV
ncbi:MAG: flagellar biosynthesis regulator FlaF, partial [Acetobacteraceae bacterium]